MATRLHVGGLGERVKEEDLRNTFSHLGSIESVEIIRTKGRSFAYINFLPSSENSLAKLFSTYNGCLWKGGKLKLEKAKENYMDRLKQEWAEDAELVHSEYSNSDQNDVDENMAASSEPKSNLDPEKMQLRMFFPKLRKVKALPLRGTGKHKYSFQRVAVPPLPVHFCDCPEHSDDIQSYKIVDKEINMANSVVNKFLNKETSLKSGCIQPLRGAQLHDSRIQDDGITEKEIHVMNSVMKKLLDREIAKTEQRDLHDSPQTSVPTVELQVDNNEDEVTDDDDIKINTGAGLDFGPESWELQTSLLNKMTRSSEQWTSDKPAKSKLGTQNSKVKPSNKKRKSFSKESNEKDPASPIHGKKGPFQTKVKESEDHLELRVPQSETNKSITSGMHSQKSSWKKLVGDGSRSSFYLSHVIPGGETNNGELPISGVETSADSKKHKRDSNVVNEEYKPCNITLSVSQELERVSSSVPENLDSQLSQSKDREGLQTAQPPSATLDDATGGSSLLKSLADSKNDKRHINVVNEEHKPSNKTSSVSQELERISNSVPENLDGQSSQSKDREGLLDGQLSQIKDGEGLPAAQPAGPSASSNKATRGSSWLQKSSWTQLVSGGKSSSFSISEILPKDLLEKPQLNKSSGSDTSNSFFSSVTAFGGSRRSRSSLAGEGKKKDAQARSAGGNHLSEAPKGNSCSDSTISKKSDLEQKKMSNSLPGVGISETCPFMRSADSLKDWQAAKTTLTSSNKKRNNKQGFAL